jgi:ribonuclease BN (tRNA processing enzyme)
MRLTFAGCGSAFTVGGDNFQSNMVLTVTRPDAQGAMAERHLLIDCGSDARFSLPGIGLSRPSDIDAVYVTHTHADHIGGLEWLALSCRYGAVRKQPRLIIPGPLHPQLWNNSLSGGLMVTEEGPVTLEDYFEVTPVGASNHFVWEGIDFELVPAVHVDGGTQRMMSYGLYFRAAPGGIYITSDVKFDPGMAERHYVRDAAVIFHDCEVGPKSGVHSHYEDLRTLPVPLRQKMWLYHYSPGPLPDARAEHFLGFVLRGQSFDLTDANLNAAKIKISPKGEI